MAIIPRSELDRQSAALDREIRRANELVRRTRRQCITLTRTIERGANSFSMAERLRLSESKFKQLRKRLRSLFNARETITVQLIKRNPQRARIVIPRGDDD